MNNNYSKYLPIGTVLMLKDAKKKLMITGFCMFSKQNSSILYDYCGCVYPEGIMSFEKTFLFNHDQIDKVYYIGFKDQEEINFKSKLENLMNKKNNGLVRQNDINQNNSVGMNTNGNNNI